MSNGARTEHTLIVRLAWDGIEAAPWRPISGAAPFNVFLPAAIMRSPSLGILALPRFL
jgi:hypothetical protein